MFGIIIAANFLRLIPMPLNRFLRNTIKFVFIILRLALFYVHVSALYDFLKLIHLCWTYRDYTGWKHISDFSELAHKNNSAVN